MAGSFLKRFFKAPDEPAVLISGKEDATTRIDMAATRKTMGVKRDIFGPIAAEYKKMDPGRDAPELSLETANTLASDAIDFFRALDDSGLHEITVFEGRGTLQDYIDQGVITPDQLSDILRHTGADVNPNQVIIPASIYLDQAGKDILALWNKTSTLEEVIGNRAHSYYSRMSRFKEFASEVRDARTLYERGTGDVSDQTMADWFSSCAVAYACLQATAKVPDPPTGIRRHLERFRDYAKNLAKRVTCLDTMVKYKQINEGFLKHLETSVFSKTSEWEAMRQAFTPVKVARPVRDLKHAFRTKEGLHGMAKFESMREFNSLNLAPGALEKIAEAWEESVDDVMSKLKRHGIEHFKKLLDISFDFTSGGEIKNVHFSPDNPEFRLWFKSKNVEETDGKSVVSTQVFTKVATDKVEKVQLPEKGKDKGGFEL
jgi:hypothetical protein